MRHAQCGCLVSDQTGAHLMPCPGPLESPRVPVFPYQVDLAAFALFASQAREWDIPEAGARVEWDHDAQLRKFWRGQVVTVLAACGFNTEGIES